MNREQYPRVTEIIYSVIPMDYEPDEYYMTRGTYIHRAIELALQDNLDWSTVDNEILPFVEQFLEFSKTIKLEVIDTERRYYNDTFKFSGKPDIIGLVNGKKSVIDIKSSRTPSLQWRLQTAAYAELTGVSKRYVIYKKDNGWQLLEHKEKTDIYVFYGCLSIFNFLKQNRGLKKCT